MAWSEAWRLVAKKLLAPILYRRAPLAGLAAPKLYLYLDALYRTRHLEGVCLEVGSLVCGTSIPAWHLLQRMQSPREYWCIDTFGGFVDAQFDTDVELGNREEKRGYFRANDMELVRKILRIHRADGVRLVQADIVALPDAELPDRVSVSLVDVDLYVPVRASLERIYERLEPGGAILVDDCDSADWQARRAYEEFMRERGLEPRIEFGMGVVEMGGQAR